MMGSFLNGFMVLALVLTVACGSDNNNDNGTPQQQEAAERFDTTLDDGTRVQGRICDGTEILETNNRVRTCQNNQWLVTVNDRDGFVAELDREDDVISIPEYTFYRINPQHSVPSTDRDVVNRVWVREDMNSGDAKDVVERTTISIGTATEE
jgi:hypothetical protein